MISAEIVADSVNQHGDRLTSLLITFPRFILAEINTHRMLSKNTSSSRAIPFKKMVEAVENDPFIPIAWQKNHSGMQGTEYFTDVDDIKEKEMYWLTARSSAVNMAQKLNNHHTTKQLCNRLLEPFMWTTMLITGSKEGWDNFFELRCPQYHLENVPTVNEDLSLNTKTITIVGKSKKELLKQINEIDNDCYTEFKNIINKYSDLDWLYLNKGQAEIHIMDLAEKIYDAMNESTPKQLKPGEWHIPFKDKIYLLDTTSNKSQLERLSMKVNNTSRADNEDMEMLAVKISTAMAARTSYTIVGDEKEIDYEKMINLHDRLIEMRHDSPLEHCARAMSDEEYNNFIKGEFMVTHSEPEYEDLGEFPESAKGWCRNFKGFIQYRHIIETNK